MALVPAGINFADLSWLASGHECHAGCK